MGTHGRLDLTFLGSGNAFGVEGRAFSSFLLDGRFLFECGPTVLQQLKRAHLTSHNVETVLVSHFHADHFFGLPFLLLDAWHEGRTADLRIVGPRGVGERVEHLLELAFPGTAEMMSYRRVYTDICDGAEGEIDGLRYKAAEVVHVPGLECYAYRVQLNGKQLLFSGDTTFCDSLLSLATGADVLVLECSCAGEKVHLSPEGVAMVRAAAGPQAETIVTHLDAPERLEGFRGLHIASDLASFSF